MSENRRVVVTRSIFPVQYSNFKFPVFANQRLFWLEEQKTNKI